MIGLPALVAAGSGISGLDWINLFSAAASIVLAIVALALSIFFFVQSKNAADQSSRSAEEISASVSRLEKLFDSLYSDTFSMMRETVTDMRQHVWKIAPGTATAKVEMKTEDEADSQALLAELDMVSKRVGLTDTKISQLREELTPILQQALETQRETSNLPPSVIRGRIRSLLKSRPLTISQLSGVMGVTESVIVDAVVDMGREGILSWPGFPDSLSSNEKLHYILPQNRTVGNIIGRSDPKTETTD